MSLSKFAASSLASATKASSISLQEQTSDSNSSNLPFGLTKWQLALILGTPIVVGAVAYYYYSQDSSNDATDGTNTNSSRAKLKSNKTPSAIKVKSGSSSGNTNSTSTPKKASLSLPAEILAKNKGNEFFRLKKYQEAAECYTEAIKLCPPNKKKDLATFYQNRAAANEQLKIEPEKIIEDCNEAVKLDNKYHKALVRRANALEKLGRLEEALADMTAVCILENFSNQTSLYATDRILRSLSKVKAREFMKNRKTTMPSNQYIRHYFSSFTRDPLFRDDQVDGDKLKHKLDELTSTCQNDDPRIDLLKGTMEILKGDCELAEKYLNNVINNIPSTTMSTGDEEKIDLKVNALIKLGSISVTDGKSPHNSGYASDDVKVNSSIEKALKYFKDAELLDSSNADIYIHRSQILLLGEKISEAKDDLEKCVSLSPNFESAIAQKFYVEFRLAIKYGDEERIKNVLTGFADVAVNHPSSAEILSLFAQSQMEMESFDLADKYFLKAIQADPYDANLYVQRAILLLRQHADTDQAVKLIEKAVSIDPKCQFAHEMLGTLLVQTGKLQDAIKSFDLALECAMTETDLGHLFTLKDAAVAQIKAANSMGITFQL